VFDLHDNIIFIPYVNQSSTLKEISFTKCSIFELEDCFNFTAEEVNSTHFNMIDDPSNLYTYRSDNINPTVYTDTLTITHLTAI